MDGRETLFEGMLRGLLEVFAYFFYLGLLILIVWAAIEFPAFGGLLVIAVVGLLFWAIFIYRD